MMKSRRMRWAGYIAGIERKGMHVEIWRGSQKKIGY
jgi:hypothetical protein